LYQAERILESLNPVQAYLILLLGAKNYEPVRGKVWLQKEMFLIVRNVEKLRDEVDYEPYFIGPYSETVDVAVEQAENMRLIKSTEEGFVLTDLGKKIFKKLVEMARKETLELVEEVKSELNDLDEDELLAYIYFTFPEMAKESRKIEEIKKRRVPLAIRLYKKGKISLSKAAEIAGMSIKSFMDVLRKKGVLIPLK